MIPGLIYISNWLSTEDEEKVLVEIEKAPWELSLKRRVQQYGPKYDYTTKKLNTTNINPISNWLEFPNLQFVPDQIIINEYQPGQGITKHKDSPLFGPVVASVSLLSDTPMVLGQYNKDNEIELILERRSIVYLTGDARSQWYHYIPPVKERRISLTFRTEL